MRNPTVRLYLYSSLAIVALTLVWGFRSIPMQAELSEGAIRSSVEQEMITLSGAARASVQALRYRLLDVLKAEGNDHSTRTFQNSPFIAATLMEWDQSQWKTLWHSVKVKEQFQLADLKTWMIEWPLAKLNGDDSFFVKVGDWQGQPYFAVAVPVRKPNNVPMIGIGIFQASQFGLSLPLDRARDVKVFDEKGFAIALAKPAYLGSSVKREEIVEDILESGEVSVRKDLKDPKGRPTFALATRLTSSNLFMEIEAPLTPVKPYRLGAWIYLMLASFGALALNAFLFISSNRPLLSELSLAQGAIETLKKQLAARPAIAPVALTVEDETKALIEEPAMADADFVEMEELPTAPELLRSVTLQKVVQAAIRSLKPKIDDAGIQVAEKGLQSIPVTTDALQLQTAIEEVLKNGIEAMMFSDEKWLTITGSVADGVAHLSIEDTGVGISNENLDKVFDPFFSTKDSQGVARGLGLNVARRVIEELKGKVSIESHQAEKHSGTTVRMEWPVPEVIPVDTPVSAAADPVKAEPPAGATAQPEGLSDLDLLADVYEEENMKFEPFPTSTRKFPEVSVRKPIVRSLD